MFKELLNLLGGFRLFIGLILMAFGCCCDFDWYDIGTPLRFISGLGGSFLILGNAKAGAGYILFLMIGMIGYCYTIQSGRLWGLEVPITLDGVTNIYPLYLEGWLKYSFRLLFAFIFMSGYRDTRED